MAILSGPDIVRDGLVLCLDAANNKSYPGTGITWIDLTERYNDGTLTNGPTFVDSNSGGIAFDGVNDYVNLSTATSLWTSNFTISFFIKSNLLANQFIFSNGSYGGAATNIWFGGGTTTNFTVHLRKADGTGAIGYNFLLSIPYTTHNYYTVIYNAENNTLKLYQNLSLIESKGTSLVDPSWMINGWRIGNTSGSYNFNGNIYLFKVYNKSLAIQEIQQNFNAARGRFGL